MKRLEQEIVTIGEGVTCWSCGQVRPVGNLQLCGPCFRAYLEAIVKSQARERLARTAGFTSL